MGQLRIEKIQELMKQEISKIILQELKDPRIGFVTVTQVEVSRDLSLAKVYISIMGSEEQIEGSWKGLQSSLGFIRREVGHRIRLRITPELRFVLDKSLDYSDHIQKLLLQIERDEKQRTEEE
ncbi:MAG: 30S ribosome-binding factor RbfA [Anaerovibrio sp.]|nr:30S ribosome-binding factor RbfA [Selenomonadaceae bacterium]MDD6397469.1 30S ribosome-binding factor RbfA [Selenomonadaceae bacterium]MDY6053198.1 30S ribosome-binding factor RbfA [Anaerovibrio sp.]